MNFGFWILDFGFQQPRASGLRRTCARRCLAATSLRNPKSKIQNPKSILLAALFSLAFASSTLADDEPSSFTLVTRDFQVKSVRLASMNDRTLVHMEESRGWVNVDLNQCVALFSPAATEDVHRPALGAVVLADGQRLPGEAVVGAPPQGETLAWNHAWLGRVDVPLRLIASVVLRSDVTAPAPGNNDIVLLVNGDRREGFVTAIGDPMTIDEGEGAAAQTVQIPLERVAAITMVAPPQTGTGRRVWFTEGTVLDVQSIGVGEDGYVRLSGSALGGGTQPSRVGLADIAAILFDRHTLVPLASLAPTRVEGPITRYVVPKPTMLDPEAALGLSGIEYSGPTIVRYALPEGCQRFVAEAELPRKSRSWGDCELIVRSDDQQVFRAHLNAATSTASVNVPLKGRELTIEVGAGAHGPIQDTLLLHRPMLLKGR